LQHINARIQVAARTFRDTTTLASICACIRIMCRHLGTGTGPRRERRPPLAAAALRWLNWIPDHLLLVVLFSRVGSFPFEICSLRVLSKDPHIFASSTGLLPARRYLSLHSSLSHDGPMSVSETHAESTVEMTFLLPFFVLSFCTIICYGLVFSFSFAFLHDLFYNAGTTLSSFYPTWSLLATSRLFPPSKKRSPLSLMLASRIPLHYS
jgi:hypothetical protein